MSPPLLGLPVCLPIHPLVHPAIQQLFREPPPWASPRSSRLGFHSGGTVAPSVA